MTIVCTIKKMPLGYLSIWKGRGTIGDADLFLQSDRDIDALESELSDKDKVALRYNLPVVAEIESNWFPEYNDV